MPQDDLFQRDPLVFKKELLSDLKALWSHDQTEETVMSWVTKPSILRQIAVALAEGVRRPTDRIVTVGPQAAVLGAALSLETGIPFAFVGSSDGSLQQGGGSLLSGNVYAGEKVHIAGVFFPEYDTVYELLDSVGLEVSAVDVLVGEPSNSIRTVFPPEDFNERINGN